jgi:hypothetical protein
LSVAGLASTEAQVFSSNAVGYVTTSISGTGFDVFSNPLVAADNSLDALLNSSTSTPDLPLFTTVYKWNGAGYDLSSYIGDAWDTPLTLEPGEGAFIFTGGTDLSVTFVGEVRTGDVSQDLVAGFNFVASVVPQTGDLATLELEDDLGLFDTVFKWNGSGYDLSAYLGDGAWDTGASPTVDEVGTPFFIQVGADTSWTRTFNIN